MVWVKFKKDFSFKPTVNSTIDYPAGLVANVTRRCADEAVARGAAELQEPETKARAKSDGG